MKILHVSYSSTAGGAAKAAWRIHCAQKKVGLDSEFLSTDSQLGKVFADSEFVLKLKTKASSFLNLLYQNSNSGLRSYSLFSSPIVEFINSSDFDIINLHWVQNEFLSIWDVKKIIKPIVWTLHDMWPFSCSEHYPSSSISLNDPRYSDKYKFPNAFPVDHWIFNQKKNSFVLNPHAVVSPSNWLYNLSSSSILFSNKLNVEIPYPIDTDFWKPSGRHNLKHKFNLPIGKKIVLFGAEASSTDPRKGFGLLSEAIKNFKSPQAWVLVTFGGQAPGHEKIGLVDAINLGRIADEGVLADLYRASDVFVLPSIMDNLPLTGMEALSCGVPLVAFNTTGLSSLVCHKSNGYLANPFDVSDLSIGIDWMVNASGASCLSDAARKFALQNFDENVVSRRYYQLYNQVLENL